MTEHTDPLEFRKELEASLIKMRIASSQFYALAVRCDLHQFVEFNGLLAKYIDLCEKTLAANKDFVQEPFRAFEYAEHDINYINEKLGCIFEGLSFSPVGELKKVIDAVWTLKKTRMMPEGDEHYGGNLKQAVDTVCALVPECYKP